MTVTMQKAVIAIEVKNRETWDVLCALQPHFKELDADFNIGNFVVVSSEDPKLEGAIMSPDTIREHFDHLTPNDLTLKTVKIVNK